ncbi:MAG: IMP dehydrogenase [Thermoguttaceae bacterium]|nr:IMP dehydrogenase [Thermoguttaceae bacterium]
MLNADDLKEMGVTFDDVLLEPQYSEVVPSEVSVKTQLTRRISLNIPFMSAPMDTVTESKMAIALARQGGVGVIHKNLRIEEQVEQVRQVKRSANGVIRNPATVEPQAVVHEVEEMMEEHGISGVPVVQKDGTLAGIVTKRDLQFARTPDSPITEVMTSDRLVTWKGDLSLEKAEDILKEKKVEKLLIVDEENKLNGLVTIRDVAMLRRFPHACRDDLGRLRVGASVGVHDYDRIDALVAAGVDFLVVDSAHGHSKNVIETVKAIKQRYDIDVIAGNVATYEGAKAIVDAGADAVKVGIGPGSICTTRVVSGVGVPQLTAVSRAVRAVQGSDVKVIADGGIRFSGDVVKALAAGAQVVMIGSLFAGFDESPGDVILSQGRSFKTYRGMGSLGAMVRGSSDRYFQKGKPSGKLVPEGVEGRVPYKGKLESFVYQMVGGVRAGMGYCGANTIEELSQKAKFIRISTATIRENHPHDISITKEAPNYSPGSSFAG